MNDRIILIFAFVFVSTFAWSQTFTISGTVRDEKNRVVEMATVVVKDSANRVITGCTGDSLGAFNLQVSPKAVTVSISCIGYQTFRYRIEKNRHPVVINAVLESDSNQLSEVVIKSKKPLIRREIDRIVLDAEKLNAVSTHFLDVLKHTPGVIVQDDDITMLNKGSIVFLMNGREMNMDIKTLVTYLGSLSTDNLRQIEVMTTPPAKYSAEGNAGVINFVTNKNRNNFVGASVSNKVSVKERMYDGVSTSLQYKHNKLETYLNAGLGFGTMQFNNGREIIYPTERWNTTDKRLKSNNYDLVTAGADYQLTRKSLIGAILSYTNIRPYVDYQSETSINSPAAGKQISFFQTIKHSDIDYGRYNTNLHYSLTDICRKGSTLNINVDYINHNAKDNVSLKSTHDETLNYLNSQSTEITIYQLKADMGLPLGKTMLEYGLAYTHSATDNLTNYKHDNSGHDLNDHFKYNEQVYATYVDVRRTLSQYLEAKIGLRAEYGNLEGNSLKLKTRTVKKQFDLFPTAYLNYSWADNNSISWSVKSRIHRPNYVDINPFMIYLDAHTVQKGKPNLQPEKSYGTELGYNYRGFSVYASATWRNHVISSYTSIDADTKLTTITTDNVMKSQLYSLDLSYYFDKIPWFDTSLEGSVYIKCSSPSEGYRLDKVRNWSTFWYMNNNIYFNENKTFMANVWGQFQGKERDVVGRSPESFRMDMGLKYLLFDKKLSIGLEYMNIISTSPKSVIETASAKYTYSIKPYKVLNITVSYRFGSKLNIQQKKFGINDSRL